MCNMEIIVKSNVGMGTMFDVAISILRVILMQCPCGFEPPEDAKYCQECGKKLRAVGDPLLELPWDTMPDKFSAEDLARYMGVSDYVVWNLTCKPRFPHSERKNIIRRKAP